MRALELDLDVYQGPFDLLLSLVFREEIDLLEVPLFEVISAYLDESEAKGATADWDEIARIKPHLSRIPLVGNGDLKTPADTATAV